MELVLSERLLAVFSPPTTVFGFRGNGRGESVVFSRTNACVNWTEKKTRFMPLGIDVRKCRGENAKIKNDRYDHCIAVEHDDGVYRQ